MNCVIYSRVSTAEQDNERQINELTEYARYKKYNLLAVFEEKVTGASKAAERIEFSKMLKFIDENEVHHVLVWEYSRLGRRMVDVVNTFEYFNDRKINIYSKKEGTNTLNEKGEKEIITTVLIGILSSISEMERDTIKARTKSGIRQNVASGGSGTGSFMPYGYKKVDKKLYIDTEEAEIIKVIFQKYLEGLGTKQLANYLNERHIPTRFNKVIGSKEVKFKRYKKSGDSFKWVDGTIYSILKNPIYKGKRLHRGETFKADAIIDEATFDKVQSTLKLKFNRKDINRKYLNIFKEKIICGKCGSTYYLHKRQNNNDSAYKCLSRRYGKSCGNPSVSIDKLNNAVYNMIVHQMEKSSTVSKRRAMRSVDTRLKNVEIEIANTTSLLEKNVKQERNLVKLQISDLISIENYTASYNELIAESNRLTNRLNELIAEQDEVKALDVKLRTIEDIDLLDPTLFKEYVAEAVEYVKIEPLERGVYDFADECYTAKQEVVMLVTIKLLYDDFKYKTIISRWSNTQFLLVRMRKQLEYTEPIMKWKYEIEKNIRI